LAGSTLDNQGGSQGSENIDIGAESQSTDLASKSIKLTGCSLKLKKPFWHWALFLIQFPFFLPGVRSYELLSFSYS